MKGPHDHRLGVQRLEEEPPPYDGSKAARRLALFRDRRGFAAPEPPAAGAERRPGEASAAVYGEAARRLCEHEAEMAAVEEPEAGVVATMETDGGEEPTEPAEFGTHPPRPPGAVPRWRPLGPRRMDNGQTYGDTRITVAGRVSCVAVDPGNRDHILCGAAGGGVWQSRDRGRSWRPRTDFAPTLTTGAIAFDPSDPRTVYVGTGEGDFYWRLGQGILRSTNGGNSFALLAGEPFVGQGFHALVVDPGDRQHLLAGTTHGLYRSTDGGANWTRRRAARTWAISISRQGRDLEVLAACADGLFRSTNGNTWNRVALPDAPDGFTRLAVDHADSSPREAYAFGAADGTAYLWRRDASGTWRTVTLPDRLRTGQAWYDWFLGVAPDRSTRIYLGAIEAWRGERRGRRWVWTRISNKPGDDIHPDQHAIAFDPVDPDTIYVGCDGGLYRSPDRGNRWESLNDGLYITEIEYIAHDPGSALWLLGGTQDNGSIRWRGSPVWDHVADGDGGDCAVNQKSPDTVFHSFYGMGMERSTRKGDFGTFSWIGPNVPRGYRALFYPPMEARGDTVAQAGQSVFVSRDNGSNWTEVNLPGTQRATAMYAPDPDNLFVGTDNGSLYRIRWNGRAWGAATALTSPRAGAWISDIHVDPRDLGRIWVTSSTLRGGRVFRSTDGGTRWTDRSAGLPDLPINAVEVDPADPERVWVAADLGVYESRDGGATWAVLGAGLPNVLVADLLFHPHARLLRAGTRNRGVWQIPVDGEMRTPICGRQWTGTVPANGTRRWFTHSWPATWHVIWTVMPTTVRRGGPQLSWKVAVEKANAEYLTYWITVKNHTDRPVTFEGRYCILSRY
ncbi:MAG TPA: hypothetical protein ENJ38_09615 [Rhodospirillales bacterium]|nr:hypothetical protein [Rhodospirillales bacterium]